MADQIRGRTRQNDDSLVPLITGLVVLAAAGPALFTALTQWLLPRLTAGGASVSLSLADWLDRNWWLVAFWVIEIALLLAFLAWARRRRRWRTRQLESVTAGLARVFPADWEPARHLRVLNWRGHRLVRIRVELTPRSPITDRAWRDSVTDTARTVLGSLAPVAWPTPPRGGVYDWGRRPPRIELRTATAATEPTHPEPRAEDELDSRQDFRLISRAAEPDDLPRTPPPDEPIYRRPRPAPAGQPAGESEPTEQARED